MDLQTPLTRISGIGPSLAGKLERLGLKTVDNLIHHYPFRYEDFSKISTLANAKVGDIVTIRGDIWSIQNTYTKNRKIITKAILNDSSASIELVWFNSPWLTKSIKAGDKLQVSGKIDKSGYKLSLLAPAWEKIINEENSTLHTGRLVPVYPETYGLTSKWLRQKIASVLPQILPKVEDHLPETIRDNLIPLPQAIHHIHLPENYPQILQAKKRLSFDELFQIQLISLKVRNDWKKRHAVRPLKIDQEKIEEFTRSLPFTLTDGQQKVIQEIIGDLKKDTAMNRLIQGEVGSGKTVVATIIVYIAYLNGLNSLVMAPTEILAQQHYKNMVGFLEPFGLKVGIYTGSKKFSDNHSNVIVGTHALLSKKLVKDNIGLVVIDEQQRFGVEQRAVLRTDNSTGAIPHFLTMTATPIPRTVALTLYGDLDLSIIEGLPKGRKPIKTHVVPSYKRNDAYKFIEKKVKEGDQVYIVTPLIEESETLVTAKAAKVEFERLQTQIFPDLKLGLMHGKLKSKEKDQVINDFQDKKIAILVSTSVVEVGVDIPNATIMVIEGAERFGLAQLHQLRGRIGRGEKQSYCLLFPEIEERNIVERLKNLERTSDGLKLAEIDLKIRGSGQIFGTMQSGRWDLKIASLGDYGLIEKSRAAAKKIIELDPTLDKHPLIKAKLANLSSFVMPD
ncbi:MAG: ATP-dependent DNA helicase RecG [Candidatus Daviesbacteria bacterium GW2011_GWA2_38_24]|uniref:ATP-dependent DNA helicase RecG n=1 Tax=Candidatus Daviesbacteria bacterium GW2011_GWA2_38_24 TaxID=1618422 RepID=A0A0G0JTS3_9BACT|nr:MAG: ATP-dependent DNA helicase RecG [Candidatus Daviesbacteria bacterium GW2011_GWA2_38_24]KKQ79618.1 MAG: ATP-dependent DNA helicase RecG [Candidatus Daviesbacteria bacterium GW2011_GWA1_38_7]OGE24179.1 MAG: ATP-dependent DNA helicase RecG [Candidatus Daviesbacteria bacterium RIFCSPHIGHO2_01_FULL_38_8]